MKANKLGFFSFRVRDEDVAEINKLAAKLNRTGSDAIRTAVHQMLTQGEYDVPYAPKSDWMRCGESLPNAAGNWVEKYINLQTGIILAFDSRDHTVTVQSIHNDSGYVDVTPKCSDSFAALVNYDWSDK